MSHRAIICRELGSRKLSSISEYGTSADSRGGFRSRWFSASSSRIRAACCSSCSFISLIVAISFVPRFAERHHHRIGNAARIQRPAACVNRRWLARYLGLGNDADLAAGGNDHFRRCLKLAILGVPRRQYGGSGAGADGSGEKIVIILLLRQSRRRGCKAALRQT